MDSDTYVGKRINRHDRKRLARVQPLSMTCPGCGNNLHEVGVRSEGMYRVIIGTPMIGEEEGGIVIEASSMGESSNSVSCEFCYETIPWLHVEEWYTTEDTIFEEDERDT